MKKIYVLATALLFAGLPLSARELTFYSGNTKIENGAKFESNKALIEEFGRTKSITFNPDLYLSSDIYTNTVEVTAICISGQTIQLCAGGNCQSGESVTKTATISSGSKLPLMFEYMAELPIDDAIPQVVTEISAVDTKHTETAISITVVYNPEGAGVNDIFANEAAFHAVDGGIAYNFASPTEVALYSLSGEKVLEASVNGEGVLSTSSLSKGIYLYCAGKLSGKVFVR